MPPVQSPFSYKFGGWQPDRPHLVNPSFPPNMEEYFNGGEIVLTTAQNAIWTAKGYRPYLPLVGTPALPAKCLGAIAGYDTSGALHVYAGTATDLYSLESGSWVSRSKSGGYTATAWNFQVYGACVYATDGTDPIQTLTMGSGVNFADLDDTDPAPKGAILGVIRDFLFVGNLAPGSVSPVPYGVQWSAVANFASFPTPNTQPAYAVQAGTQYLYPEYGPLMAISDNESFGLLFQRSGIQRCEYVGGNEVFQFYTYEKKRGALGQNAVARVGNKYYFASPDGFFMTDGANTTPIGYEKVDNWFFANAKTSTLANVCAAADTQNKLIYFAFESTSGSNLDSILAYNYLEQRWSYCQQAQEFMFQGLNGNGGWVPFGFDTSHRYGGYTGAPTSATLETLDFNFNQGGRSLITGLRSLSQGTAQMRVGSRANETGSVNWTSYYNANSRDNFVGLRSEGTFHRIGVNLAGDFGFCVGATAWMKGAGIL
ncbi:MAG: hypothetical protein KGL35_16945 [Bradyrhizobium sp.]|nr:hypothetical protein [Bradyrhizobium sp.]